MVRPLEETVREEKTITAQGTMSSVNSKVCRKPECDQARLDGAAYCQRHYRELLEKVADRITRRGNLTT